MKHAAKEALSKIKSLLFEIRKIGELKEKKKGIFYKGCIAFLHFHEHDKELFADVKINDKWERFSVTNKVEQIKFLKLLDTYI